LVEDEPGILEALTSFLRMHGILVVSARSSVEATRILEVDLPSCLVTDENLPDGSGRRVVEAFRERDPTGHILLYTANSSAEILAWAATVERLELRQKPMRPADLLAWIQGHERAGAAGAEDDGSLDALPLEEAQRSLCRQALEPFRHLGSVTKVLALGARVLIVLELRQARPGFDPGTRGHCDVWLLQDAEGGCDRLAILVDLSRDGRSGKAHQSERRLLWNGEC
jgi:DNA-binding response OmpR family regulator